MQKTEPAAERDFSRHEAVRIVSYVLKQRELYDNILGNSEVDVTWLIYLHLYRSFLTEFNETVTSLAESLNAPRTTIVRRVHSLIADGTIRTVPKFEGSKTFYLLPSAALQEKIAKYVAAVKVSIAQDLYSEEYQSSGQFTLSTGPANRPGTALAGRNIVILAHEDELFGQIKNAITDPRNALTQRDKIHLMSMQKLEDVLFDDARLRALRPDLICTNLPWMGELVRRGIVRPFTAAEKARIPTLDLYDPALINSCSWEDQLYGVPVYTTFFVLASLKSASAGLKPSSSSTEDLLRWLPTLQRGGVEWPIIWPGQRGTAMGTTFIAALAAFGGSAFGFPQTKFNYVPWQHNSRKLTDLDIERIRKTLQFLKDLAAVSHPQTCDADTVDCTQLFMEGNIGAVLTWTMRAMRLELDYRSKVKGKVNYTTLPSTSFGSAAIALGGFALCIPAFADKTSVDLALSFIETVYARQSRVEEIYHGFPFLTPMNEMSLNASYGLMNLAQLFKNLAAQRVLQFWPRPSLPGYRADEQELGMIAHDYVFGTTQLDIATERMVALLLMRGHFEPRGQAGATTS